jgi:uncharacterized membrane protein/sporulation protein YlmC with PRC-barrel domain
MLEIPMNADVLCVDGKAGKITQVIVDPRRRAVTHIVVKHGLSGDRLVPIEQIDKSGPNLVQLKCSVAELTEMEPFSTTHYADDTFDSYVAYTAYYDGMGDPYVFPTTPMPITQVDEAIPPGERALMPGAKVEATDGTVGTVGELIVDSESGEITHFRLQTSGFWGKKDVVLPISAVQSAEENVVHIKLDKKALKSLPALPRNVKAEKKGKRGMVELIARVFDAPNKAAESLAFIQEVQRQQQGAVKIHKAAILVKDAEGRLTITEPGELSPKKGTIMGAVAGGLLGALAGPVGIVVGAAAGAGLGRVSTRWVDLGLPNDFLQRLQGYLQPNSSALVLLVEHRYLERLSDSTAGMEGIVMQYTLSDDVVEQLLKEQ